MKPYLALAHKSMLRLIKMVLYRVARPWTWDADRDARYGQTNR